MGLVPLSIMAGFFVTALLYAAVGFGGGSTYAALLALSGMDYRLLPMVTLACNIIVVAGSSIRFVRGRITPWRGALLMTALAAPAALIGGLTPIDRDTFMLLLGGSLLLTGVTMLIPLREAAAGEPTRFARAMPFVAAPLGYLAGLVGIGGGIFLAPLLHLTRWKDPRAIAATASIFILINSLFGLAGQMLKQGHFVLEGAVGAVLPLLIAVAVGGQVGSLMAVKFLPQRAIRWLTALLVIWVGVRLLTS